MTMSDVIALAAPPCSHAEWRSGIHTETNGAVMYYTRKRRFVLRTVEDEIGAKPVWVLDCMRPPEQPEPELEPPDLVRCQGLILAGSFMTLGPRSWIRCANKPVYIAKETEPGPDELYGSMSLCEECAGICEKKRPTGVVYEKIESK